MMKTSELRGLIIANQGTSTVKRKDILRLGMQHGYEIKEINELIGSALKVSHGTYDLSQNIREAAPLKIVPRVETPEPKAQFIPAEEGVYVPEKVEHYVPWGHHRDIRTILNTRMFYPIYLTGLSGNGRPPSLKIVFCSRWRSSWFTVLAVPSPCRSFPALL
jgi:hypothetical protein